MKTMGDHFPWLYLLAVSPSNCALMNSIPTLLWGHAYTSHGCSRKMTHKTRSTGRPEPRRHVRLLQATMPRDCVEFSTN